MGGGARLGKVVARGREGVGGGGVLLALPLQHIF